MAKRQNHDTNTNGGHGSVSSYVIGFVLSLVFTIIPYYMVTRQIAAGTTLLLVILGFAVVQMFIQLFFFLHLGRGPKPLYNVIFFAGTAGMMVLVIGASILIMNNLYRNMSPEAMTMRLAQDENIAEIGGRDTGACQGNKAGHEVIISQDDISPSHINARRCDTLAFKSGDGADYEIMFGPHEAPMSYGGLFEVPVRGDRSKIITLNEVGNFYFYDSSNHDNMGHFSVKP